MMQYKYMITLITLVLIVGCSNKIPTIDEENNQNGESQINNEELSDTTTLMEDTIEIDEAKENKETMVEEEKNSKDVMKQYNSSVNGFKSIYFNFGEYSISSIMDENMNKNVKMAQSIVNQKIKIEGNCDEYGTDEYNYALGLKRAKVVKNALTLEGIDSSKMVIMSYGESRPVCSDFSEICYQRNRRVDLRLSD